MLYAENKEKKKGWKRGWKRVESEEKEGGIEKGERKERAHLPVCPLFYACSNVVPPIGRET